MSTGTTAIDPAKLANIGSSISPAKVYTIQFPTASGKTTLIPSAIYNAERSRKVLVSLPTRIAAKSAAERVKAQTPSLRVDYKIRGHDANFTDSDIIYASSGSALLMIYGMFRGGRPITLKYHFIIIVDEVHTGNVESTLIIALWRYYRLSSEKSQHRFVPSLVLMTATPSPISWLTPPPISLTSKVVPRNILKVFIDSPQHSESDREAFKTMNRYNRMALIIYNICRGNQMGHVLSFVPGKIEALKLKSLVDAKLSQIRANVVTDVAYGSMDTKSLARILTGTDSRTKRVIIATNVAESSITSPQVVYIVDSALEKAPGTASSGGFSLEERRITKNSALQRMGRAGRTPGTEEYSTYFSVLTEKEYNSLEDQRPADIYTIGIHKEVIQMMDNLLDPIAVLQLGSRSFSDKLDRTIRDLKDMELIREEVEGNDVFTVVTKEGSFASVNPQRVESSAFIWYWLNNYQANNLYACAVVSCMLDTNIGEIISVPNGGNNDFKALTELFKDILGPDSLTTVLNIWNKVIENNPYLHITEEWAASNNLSMKVISEFAENLRIAMMVIGRLSGVPVIQSLIDITLTIQQVIPAMRKVFSTWSMVREGGYTYKRVGPSSVTYILGGKIPYLKSNLGDDPIICLTSIENKRGKESTHSISLFTFTHFIESKYEGVGYYPYSSATIETRDMVPTFTGGIGTNEMFEEDVRMDIVTPLDIGLGPTIYVPDYLAPYSPPDGNMYQKIRTISECLVPPLVRIPKGVTRKVRVRREVIEENLDDLLELLNSISELDLTIGGFTLSTLSPDNLPQRTGVISGPASAIYARPSFNVGSIDVLSEMGM